MAYVLGARSLGFCSHVDPDMMRVVQLAIQKTTQDFGFTEEQSRTLAQQEAMVARGVSRTLLSHHRIDCPSPGVWAAPGYSGAVDAVPWTGTAFSWAWPLIFPIASAFSLASAELGIEITSGIVWDKLMSEYGSSPAEIEAEMNAYVARERAKGIERPLIDGPHFEKGRN